MQQHPKRIDDAIVETVGEELCIYDPKRKRVHSLNPTAAYVWHLCDGQTSTSEIALRSSDELGTKHAGALVDMSLQRLRNAGLLDADSAPQAATVSRRQALGRLGLAASTLPVIVSIIAPTPAQASSAVCSTDPDFANSCGSQLQAGSGQTCNDCYLSCATLCQSQQGSTGVAAYFVQGDCQCCCQPNFT